MKKPKVLSKEDYSSKLYKFMKNLKDNNSLSDKEWEDAKQLILESKLVN